MHIRAALVMALAAMALYAQTSPDPDVARAQSEIRRTRELVEAGVAPRKQLESAEELLKEAEETAWLRRTLYSADVTEQQADEMVALSALRLERRERAVARAKQLVDQGVAAQRSLTPFVDEADRARSEHRYAMTRAKLIHELGAMAREEAELEAKLITIPAGAYQSAERHDGDRTLTPRDIERLNDAFERAFSMRLPVSANGETAVHRALGFDHRDRVDVAINPDQPQGVWLRQYLAAKHIPYFAFRGAVPGKATGPHIHIGPMSGRLAHGG